jgi:hypothetical protein
MSRQALCSLPPLAALNTRIDEPFGSTEKPARFQRFQIEAFDG